MSHHEAAVELLSRWSEEDATQDPDGIPAFATPGANPVDPKDGFWQHHLGNYPKYLASSMAADPERHVTRGGRQ